MKNGYAFAMFVVWRPLFWQSFEHNALVSQLVKAFLQCLKLYKIYTIQKMREHLQDTSLVRFKSDFK